MKNASALLAMASSSPRGEGLATCCSIDGSAANRVRASASRMSAAWLSSAFHLTATEVVHQKLAT